MTVQFAPINPLKRNPNYSVGFNLPFSGDELLQNFDFVSIKNGAQQVTASRNMNSGGTTSISAPGVKLFNTAASGGTVSYRQTQGGNGDSGQQFFTTPDTNTSTQAAVTLKGGIPTLALSQTGTVSNKTLANRLQNLSLTDYLLIGGAGLAAVLGFMYLKR